MIDRRHIGRILPACEVDVERSRLRFFAKAIGEANPIYTDEQAMPQCLWESYKTHYLDKHGLTVENVYNSEYSHSSAYVVAESLADFDELFQRFRFCHIQLIHRTIGLSAKSLKGRSVDLLNEGLRVRFFPDLWQIRVQMTDSWGGKYGAVREPIGTPASDSSGGPAENTPPR